LDHTKSVWFWNLGTIFDSYPLTCHPILWKNNALCCRQCAVWRACRRGPCWSGDKRPRWCPTLGWPVHSADLARINLRSILYPSERRHYLLMVRKWVQTIHGCLSQALGGWGDQLIKPKVVIKSTCFFLYKIGVFEEKAICSNILR